MATQTDARRAASEARRGHPTPGVRQRVIRRTTVAITMTRASHPVEGRTNAVFGARVVEILACGHRRVCFPCERKALHRWCKACATAGVESS
jgi:hypothetical protein